MSVIGQDRPDVTSSAEARRRETLAKLVALGFPLPIPGQRRRPLRPNRARKRHRPHAAAELLNSVVVETNLETMSFVTTTQNVVVVETQNVTTEPNVFPVRPFARGAPPRHAARFVRRPQVRQRARGRTRRAPRRVRTSATSRRASTDSGGSDGPGGDPPAAARDARAQFTCASLGAHSQSISRAGRRLFTARLHGQGGTPSARPSRGAR